MSYWNYRMTRRTTPEKVVVYEIHEVYYAKGGRIESWAMEPSSPFGETRAELVDDVTAMAACAAAEVIDLDELEARMAEKHGC